MNPEWTTQLRRLAKLDRTNIGQNEESAGSSARAKQITGKN